eukprot:6487888-Amphidinium_carterae.2
MNGTCCGMTEIVPIPDNWQGRELLVACHNRLHQLFGIESGRVHRTRLAQCLSQVSPQSALLIRQSRSFAPTFLVNPAGGMEEWTVRRAQITPKLANWRLESILLHHRHGLVLRTPGVRCDAELA